MSSRILNHVRRSAVGYVALFLVLAGTASASVPSIFSADIVDGEVKSVDVADNGLTGTDVTALSGADVNNESLNGADVTGLTGADVSDNSLTGADVSGLSTADVTPNGLTGGAINESTLSVAAMGCQSGKVLGFARIKGTAGIPTAYVDQAAFIDKKNNCSGGRVEVRRASEGVYFVRFVGNPATLALGTPNQDGASTALSGDTDNIISIGKITAAGLDQNAFRVDVHDTAGPGADAAGRQDGQFTILLP